MGQLPHLGLLPLHVEPDTRVLVISGKHIVHCGPFGMNTMAEVKQAVADCNLGKLVSCAIYS